MFLWTSLASGHTPKTGRCCTTQAIACFIYPSEKCLSLNTSESVEKMPNVTSILSLRGDLIQAYSYPNGSLALCTEAPRSWNAEQIAICPWRWSQIWRLGLLHWQGKSKPTPWQLQLQYLMNHQSSVLVIILHIFLHSLIRLCMC